MKHRDGAFVSFNEIYRDTGTERLYHLQPMNDI